MLGGKGANLAEMANIGLPRASRLHHHVPDLHGVRQRRQHVARGRARHHPGVPRGPRGPHGQEDRRRGGPAARVRALRRADVHAGHDGHGAEPRPERRVHQRPHRADREPALRLGLLPPLHPDVLQRGHGPRRRPVRERHHGHEERARRGVRHRPRPPRTCKELVAEFKQIFAENVDAAAYPEPRRGRLPCSSRRTPACSCSWPSRPSSAAGTTRAPSLYRKQNKIADDLGTAVNVQSMVFGNKGNTSATGVAFTRNPANGEKEFYGDYLVNAQGEDVVAGIRNTSPIADLKHVDGLRRGRPRARGGVRHPGEPLSATCATSSSPSSRASSGCSRPAWASAPPPPRSTSPSRWRRKASSPRKRPSCRVDPEQLDQLLHPQFDKNASYDVRRHAA